MKKIKLALLIDDPTLLSRTKQDLVPFSSTVEFSYFGNVEDLYKTHQGVPLNGIVVDVKKTIKFTAGEKSKLDSLLTYMPTGKIRIDPVSNSIHGSWDHQMINTGHYFTAVIDYIMKKGVTRQIRTNDRVEKILNVMLLEGNRTDNGLQANTLNISTGGMYVVTTHVYPIETAVRISIKEMRHEEPIHARVAWNVHWGQSNSWLAGMGLEFKELSDQTKKRINELVNS